MGDAQSAQREEKKDAAAEEEDGVKVDDVQTEHNIEDQISEVYGKADSSTAAFNGHCEDNIAAEGLAIVSPDKDVSKTEKPLKEETPIENVENNQTKLPEDANEEAPMGMTEMEAKQNDINESFRRFFSNIGLKLTVKRGSADKVEITTHEPVEEPNKPEDTTDTAKEIKSENAEVKTDLNAAQETHDNSSMCPTITGVTSEPFLEKVEEKTTATKEEVESDYGGATPPAIENAQEEATPEEEPQPTSPGSSPEGEPRPTSPVSSPEGEPRPTSPVSSPEGEPRPTSPVSSPEEEPRPMSPVSSPEEEPRPTSPVSSPEEEPRPTSPVSSPEGEPRPTSPVSSPEEEVGTSPFKRFFKTGIFAGLRKKKKLQKSAEDEETEKEQVDIEKKETTDAIEQTVQDLQQDIEIIPDVEKATIEKEITEEFESAAVAPVMDEAKPPSTDPSTIVMTEPEVLSSQEKDKVQASPLKRLLSGSSLRRHSKKPRSRKSSDARLSDSGEYVSDQFMSSTESAENQTEESPAPLSAESAGEEDGAWASFKKLLTPKKHTKKSSMTQEEVQIPGSADEAKTSEEQISDISTEEGKKRKDSSVSWESVLCGSGKRRSRKTSDSEDEPPLKDSGNNKQDSGHEQDAELPLRCSNEVHEISAPESDEGSTWKSFKKLLTPKRKPKDEDKRKDNIPSDSEASQDDSSFFLMKLLPGRKMKKPAEMQDQASSDEAEKEVGSGDEDSETPAVVPLSEFDTVETAVHILTQADIESYSPKEAERELQQDLLDQMDEPVLPQESLQSETEKVQNNQEALKKEECTIRSEEPDDDSEIISKHQQLSDIPEEGAFTETMVTPASIAEEAVRDDTIAEDLTEITSEAITAPEPLDVILTDETEMISAVSQLSESSKTSGNTTPVPAEYDVKDTEVLLQQVAESISMTPKDIPVCSEEPTAKKTTSSLSQQILHIFGKVQPKLDSDGGSPQSLEKEEISEDIPAVETEADEPKQTTEVNIETEEVPEILHIEKEAELPVSDTNTAPGEHAGFFQAITSNLKEVFASIPGVSVEKTSKIQEPMTELKETISEDIPAVETHTDEPKQATEDNTEPEDLPAEPEILQADVKDIVTETETDAAAQSVEDGGDIPVCSEEPTAKQPTCSVSQQKLDILGKVHPENLEIYRQSDETAVNIGLNIEADTMNELGAKTENMSDIRETISTEIVSEVPTEEFNTTEIGANEISAVNVSQLQEIKTDLEITDESQHLVEVLSEVTEAASIERLPEDEEDVSDKCYLAGTDEAENEISQNDSQEAESSPTVTDESTDGAMKQEVQIVAEKEDQAIQNVIKPVQVEDQPPAVMDKLEALTTEEPEKNSVRLLEKEAPCSEITPQAEVFTDEPEQTTEHLNEVTVEPENKQPQTDTDNNSKVLEVLEVEQVATVDSEKHHVSSPENITETVKDKPKEETPPLTEVNVEQVDDLKMENIQESEELQAVQAVMLDSQSRVQSLGKELLSEDVPLAETVRDEPKKETGPLVEGNVELVDTPKTEPVQEADELPDAKANTLDSEEQSLQSAEKDVISEHIAPAETVRDESKEETVPLIRVYLEEIDAFKTKDVQKPEELQAAALDSEAGCPQSINVEQVDASKTKHSQELEDLQAVQAATIDSEGVSSQSHEEKIISEERETVEEQKVFKVVEANTVDSEAGSPQSLEKEVISKEVSPAEKVADEPQEETIPVTDVNGKQVDGSKTDNTQGAKLDSDRDSPQSLEKVEISEDIPAVETETDDSKQATKVNIEPEEVPAEPKILHVEKEAELPVSDTKTAPGEHAGFFQAITSNLKEVFASIPGVSVEKTSKIQEPMTEQKETISEGIPAVETHTDEPKQATEVNTEPEELPVEPEILQADVKDIVTEADAAAQSVEDGGAQEKETLIEDVPEVASDDAIPSATEENKVVAQLDQTMKINKDQETESIIKDVQAEHEDNTVTTVDELKTLTTAHISSVNEEASTAQVLETVFSEETPVLCLDNTKALDEPTQEVDLCAVQVSAEEEEKEAELPGSDTKTAAGEHAGFFQAITSNLKEAFASIPGVSVEKTSKIQEPVTELKETLSQDIPAVETHIDEPKQATEVNTEPEELPAEPEILQADVKDIVTEIEADAAAQSVEDGGAPQKEISSDVPEVASDDAIPSATEENKVVAQLDQTMKINKDQETENIIEDVQAEHEDNTVTTVVNTSPDNTKPLDEPTHEVDLCTVQVSAEEEKEKEAELPVSDTKTAPGEHAGFFKAITSNLKEVLASIPGVSVEKTSKIQEPITDLSETISEEISAVETVTDEPKQATEVNTEPEELPVEPEILQTNVKDIVTEADAAAQSVEDGGAQEKEILSDVPEVASDDAIPSATEENKVVAQLDQTMKINKDQETESIIEDVQAEHEDNTVTTVDELKTLTTAHISSVNEGASTAQVLETVFSEENPVLCVDNTKALDEPTQEVDLCAVQVSAEEEEKEAELPGSDTKTTAGEHAGFFQAITSNLKEAFASIPGVSVEKTSKIQEPMTEQKETISEGIPAVETHIDEPKQETEVNTEPEELSAEPEILQADVKDIVTKIEADAAAQSVEDGGAPQKEISSDVPEVASDDAIPSATEENKVVAQLDQTMKINKDQETENIIEDVQAEHEDNTVTTVVNMSPDNTKPLDEPTHEVDLCAVQVSAEEEKEKEAELPVSDTKTAPGEHAGFFQAITSNLKEVLASIPGVSVEKTSKIQEPVTELKETILEEIPPVETVTDEPKQATEVNTEPEELPAEREILQTNVKDIVTEADAAAQSVEDGGTQQKEILIEDVPEVASDDAIPSATEENKVVAQLDQTMKVNKDQETESIIEDVQAEHEDNKVTTVDDASVDNTKPLDELTQEVDLCAVQVGAEEEKEAELPGSDTKTTAGEHAGFFQAITSNLKEVFASIPGVSVEKTSKIQEAVTELKETVSEGIPAVETHIDEPKQATEVNTEPEELPAEPEILQTDVKDIVTEIEADAAAQSVEDGGTPHKEILSEDVPEVASDDAIPSATEENKVVAQLDQTMKINKDQETENIIEDVQAEHEDNTVKTVVDTSLDNTKPLDEPTHEVDLCAVQVGAEEEKEAELPGSDTNTAPGEHAGFFQAITSNLKEVFASIPGVSVEKTSKIQEPVTELKETISEEIPAVETVTDEPKQATEVNTEPEELSAEPEILQADVKDIVTEIEADAAAQSVEDSGTQQKEILLEDVPEVASDDAIPSATEENKVVAQLDQTMEINKDQETESIIEDVQAEHEDNTVKTVVNMSPDNTKPLDEHTDEVDLCAVQVSAEEEKEKEAELPVSDTKTAAGFFQAITSNLKEVFASIPGVSVEKTSKIQEPVTELKETISEEIPAMETVTDEPKQATEVNTEPEELPAEPEILQADVKDIVTEIEADAAAQSVEDGGAQEKEILLEDVPEVASDDAIPSATEENKVVAQLDQTMEINKDQETESNIEDVQAEHEDNTVTTVDDASVDNTKPLDEPTQEVDLCAVQVSAEEKKEAELPVSDTKTAAGFFQAITSNLKEVFASIPGVLSEKTAKIQEPLTELVVDVDGTSTENIVETVMEVGVTEAKEVIDGCHETKVTVHELIQHVKEDLKHPDTVTEEREMVESESGEVIKDSTETFLERRDEGPSVISEDSVFSVDPQPVDVPRSSSIDKGESPSSLSLEFKLNIKFAQTPPTQRLEPMKQINMAEVGVQADEAVEPINATQRAESDKHTELMEVAVQTTEIKEAAGDLDLTERAVIASQPELQDFGIQAPTRQFKSEERDEQTEDNDQDVWLDAEEDIYFQEETEEPQKPESEQEEKLEHEFEMAPIESKAEVEESQQEMHKTEETCEIESDGEDFAFALEHPESEALSVPTVE